jgi:probable FeS assembly SUF system protein SufT
MTSNDPIKISRDIEAVEIPAGTRMTLEKDSEVWITQSLGGSYTVRTNLGFLARISGNDADALGLEKTADEEANKADKAPATKEDVEKRIWEELANVYDPEIPVNVVDLGLIYECKVHPLSEGTYKVAITMTLTAPGCGMGDVLRQDAETRIAGLPGVTVSEVNMVIDPPWNPSLMSEAARLQLGMM